MNILELAFVILLALVFGSFLNCAAMRIVRGEDFIHGRSRCPFCGKELAPIDLIPVISWLLSGARCRYCKEKISARYPATELGFAALCVGLYLRFGYGALLHRNLILTGCLFVLALVDMESLEIPDGCLLIALAAWVVFLPFVSDLSLAHYYIACGILTGAAMLFCSLVMDKILKKESLGGGDIKLFALLGLYLGFPRIVFLIMLSCVLGLLFVGARALLKKGSVSEPLPFGPAVALAGYIMLLWGDSFIEWYVSICHL